MATKYILDPSGNIKKVVSGSLEEQELQKNNNNYLSDQFDLNEVKNLKIGVFKYLG